jgi:hypothetical protein
MPNAIPESLPFRQPKAVEHGHEIAVLVERQVEHEPSNVEGTLAELRSAGVKVKVPSILQFAEYVQLRIRSPELGLDLATEAQVYRVSEGEGGDWFAHLRCPDEVSEELGSALAKNGYLNFRQDVRCKCRIPAKAVWHLDGHKARVEVRDYSAGGFRFAVPEAGKFGSHLQLEFELGHELSTIRGVVRWQLATEGRTIVGCSFVDRDAFKQLKVAATQYQAREAEAGLRSTPKDTSTVGKRWCVKTSRTLRHRYVWGPIVCFVVLLITGYAFSKSGQSEIPSLGRANGQRAAKVTDPVSPPKWADAAPSTETTKPEVESEWTEADGPDDTATLRNASDRDALVCLNGPVSWPSGVGETAPDVESATIRTGDGSAAEVPRVAVPVLIIRNPSDSSADVHFLIDGEADSLAPGQSQRYGDQLHWRMDFHRGGDWGDAHLELHPGTYEFRAGKRGWELKESPEQSSADWVP